MITEQLYYKAICDSCGMSIGSFDQRSFPGPQVVTRQLLERHGWTAFDDIHHCFRCVPICASCGMDDIECDCIGGPDEDGISHSGDSAYVSREPNVIEDGSAVASRAYPAQTLHWDERAGPVVSFNEAPPVPSGCQPGDCEYDLVDEYCRRCDVPDVEEHRRGEG